MPLAGRNGGASILAMICPALSRLAGQADSSRPAGEGRVHASYWWITEDGTYLGAITLRDTPPSQ